MKRYGLAAFGLIIVVLSGCTPRQPAEAPETAKRPKTQITLFTWTPEDELRVNQELIAKFESEHPDIQVKLINDASHAAMQKLQTMIAGGTPPDVMSIHGAFLIPLAAKGALYDLGKLARRDPNFDIGDFYPRLLELCRYKGILYSIPRYTSVYALFYNKELFDSAGLSYPDDTWTWKTYLETAKKLTKDTDGDGENDQWGCTIDFWGARLYPWLWQNGADLMNKDRTRCIIDSPEAIEALQFVHDLAHKYHVAPLSNPNNEDETLDSFCVGKIGMYMTGPWDIQALRDAEKSSGLKWDVAPLPKGKVQATMLGMENYGIAAATKHIHEAWALYKYLVSPQSQEIMADRLDKMPSRISVAEGPYLAADCGYNRKVFVDALKYAHKPPNIPQWNEIQGILKENFDAIWAGERDVAEGCKRAAEQVNKVLAESAAP